MRKMNQNRGKYEFCQTIKNLTMKYIQNENHSNHLT
jgi:hypothetical protein